MKHRILLPALFVLTAQGLVPGQTCSSRVPVKINDSFQNGIIDAKISPDGQHVAYLENDITGRLLHVRDSGAVSPSVQLVAAPTGTLSYTPTFAWRTFLLNGNPRSRVVFTARNATGSFSVREYDVASGQTITNATFTTVIALAIQPNPIKDKYCVVGYTAGASDLFVVDAAGAVVLDPPPLVSTQTVLTAFDIDPSQQYALFKRQVTFPSGPFGEELVRIDTATNLQTTIIPASIFLTTRVDAGTFGDDHQNVFFGYTYTQFVVSSFIAGHYTDGSPPPSWVDLNNNAHESFERTSLTPSHLQQTPTSKSWMVASGNHLIAGTPQARLALLPVQGGGEVLILKGFPHFRILQPTIDRSGTRIAFRSTSSSTSTSPDVYVVNTDREIRATPKAVLGGSFTVELPSAVGETCAMFVSFGLTTPTPIPPFCDFFELAAPSATVYITPGTGQPISTQINLPNDPAFRGLAYHFQGIRGTATAGDITRVSRVRFF